MNLLSKAKDLFVGRKIKTLFAHVWDRDVDYIKTVDQELLLNARDKDGDTVLIKATGNGDLDLCEEILKKCPSLLYVVNNRNQTVLYLATTTTKLNKRISIIDFFISAGVDDRVTSNEGDRKFKRWMNMQDFRGYTALFMAVKLGNLHIVKRLIEVDCEYNLGLSKVVEYEGETPLDLAKKMEAHEMVKLLTDEGDRYSDYVPYSTAMVLLDRAWWGDLDYIETVELNVLLNSRDQDSSSVLSMATKLNHLDCCKKILKRCPSLLYHHDSNKKSVLHAAIIHESYRLIDFFVTAGLKAVKSEDCSENMIRFRKWINLQDSYGHTALISAVMTMHSYNDIVKRFVEVDRRYKLGLSEIVCSENRTALQWAMHYGMHEMIKALTGSGDANLDYGANTGAILLNTTVASKNKIYTFAEVSKHNNLEDCWLLIDNKVFDVTNFFGDHPGGNEVLLKASGKDATTDFKKVHSHNSNAVTLMDKFYVGVCDSVTSTLAILLNTTVASKSNIFTLAEVSKHNSLKDCWLLIDDKVYDVTKLIGDHPGGNKVLLKASGKDATTDFKKVHSHSSNAVTLMDKFYVGMCDSVTSSLSKLSSDKPRLYSRVQLKEFTKDFSQLVGSGGFGDVYKGQFSDGVFIAVKVLKNIELMEKFMKEQFVAEVDTMGRAYHRNLIKLYGYCYEAKFKALVYEYMENGSFDRILFEKKLDISWKELHNIAKEIAQGISYLHESCSPQIIHQDIKPSNVLLDSNLSPKVIDFGLAKVNTEESDQFEQTKIKGSRDYMAPEVNQPEQVKLSCKVDVYSFGKMLFDILGSKRNHVEKSRFPGQVWEKYKTNQLENFILGCGIKEEDIKKAKRLAVIALLCVEHNPRARPMLSNVVKMLEGKIKLGTPLAPFYPNYYNISESSSMSDSRDY